MVNSANPKGDLFGERLGVSLSFDLSLYWKVVLLRGSVDNGETQRENIRVTLPSQEIIEAEVTLDTLGNYGSLEGLVVLCNKSYGNAALADASSVLSLCCLLYFVALNCYRFLTG